MDRELGVLHGHEYDDLKQVCGAVRSDDQPTVGVFAGVFDDKRMVNGVLNVAVLDAVLSRRLVNLRRDSVLRKDVRGVRPSVQVSPSYATSTTAGRPFAGAIPMRGREPSKSPTQAS